jgi:hypothetical protein
MIPSLMTPSLRTAFIVLAAFAASASASAPPALAQSSDDAYPVHDLTLDIDQDGKPDRAVLRGKEPGPFAQDLYIYLDAGPGPLDPARQPSFFKKDAAPAAVQFLEVGGKNKSSLKLQYGCGGCSNDYETILTIIHRRGEFIVAGYTLAWETRDQGAGQCDINLLTGKGVISKNGGKERPVKGTFKPVKLAAWNEEMEPGVCQR